jgi:RNA polymerase sigma-70 factor (ECF subfamily)
MRGWGGGTSDSDAGGCIAMDRNNGVERADHILAAAARGGCSRSFELLMDRYHAPILRYLWNRTGDKELASDLAQETFVSAWLHLDQLRDDACFHPWLYRIADNGLRMDCRRRHQELSLESLGDVDRDPALAGRDASDRVCDRIDITAVLEEMHPALREALVAHVVLGRPYAEVGIELHVTPEAARQRVHRAKLEFRRLYWALDEGPDRERRAAVGQPGG